MGSDCEWYKIISVITIVFIVASRSMKSTTHQLLLLSLYLPSPDTIKVKFNIDRENQTDL